MPPLAFLAQSRISGRAPALWLPLSSRERGLGGEVRGLATASGERSAHPGDGAEQRARNHDALNLVRALEDLGDLDVAHVALDRPVAHVARAAEHLYRVGGD